MTDITKCINVGCKKASSCYRITATNDAWQSYSDFSKSPTGENGECEYYWETTNLTCDSETK